MSDLTKVSFFHTVIVNISYVTISVKRMPSKVITVFITWHFFAYCSIRQQKTPKTDKADYIYTQECTGQLFCTYFTLHLNTYTSTAQKIGSHKKQFL